MTHEEIIKAAEIYALKQSANGNNASDYDFAKEDFIAGAEWASVMRWRDITKEIPKEDPEHKGFTVPVLVIAETGAHKGMPRTCYGNLYTVRHTHNWYSVYGRYKTAARYWMPIPLIEDRP